MKLHLFTCCLLLTWVTGCATDLSSRRFPAGEATAEAGLVVSQPSRPSLESLVAPAGFTANDSATDEKTKPNTPVAQTRPTTELVTRLPLEDLTATGIENAARPENCFDETEEGHQTTPANPADSLNPPGKADSIASLVSIDSFGHSFDGINRQQLHQQVLDNHPGIAKAEAEYESLKGKYHQAGLPLNPTAGIVSGDINEEGGAGRHGIFFGREIIRGGKLEASQRVVCAELESANDRLNIVKRRLLTDVDRFYYEVLVAQEQLALAQQMTKVSEEAFLTSQKLFEAAEVPQTSVLQLKLELKKSQMLVRRFEAAQLSSRRKLAAIIGQEDLPTPHVAGNAREIVAVADFEAAYDRLLRDSPELSQLFSQIEINKRQLARDQLQPISNVTWQTTLQYDFITDDVIGGVQVGWTLPKFDRNQGKIYQTSQTIVAAQRATETKALELRRRLAEAYELYLDAKLQVDAFENEIMPIATESADLLMQAFEVGETGVLDVLVSQRTLFQTNLTYLQNLRTLWRQSTAIEGLLLDDGLADSGS